MFVHPCTSDGLNTALAGRYRVEHALGQGGMPMLYLAEDLKRDRKGSIRVLKPELAAVLDGSAPASSVTWRVAVQVLGAAGVSG